MSTLANPVVTEDEYLARAETSKVRLEFIGGKVRMMAGGSLDHSTICYRLGLLLGPLADARGCRGFNSDVRVKVKASGEYVYPDLSFACRKAEQERKSLLNPTFVVEVLSPSTMDNDRGQKRDLYESIPSLEEYLMVHSEEPWVEHSQRHGAVWVVESVRGLDASLEVLGGTMCLNDIYRDVEFTATE